MLISLILIPLAGALIVSLSPSNSAENVKNIKQFGLAVSLLVFCLSQIIWSGFDSNVVGYQFQQIFSTSKIGSLNLGIDGISLYFVLLTAFISPVSILSNWSNIANQEQLKLIMICYLLLEGFLMAVFLVCDLILFYIFFESVLIPLFLIVVSNSQNDKEPRVRAGMLLFLYTLFGSLFMLLSILNLYHFVGSTSFDLINQHSISLDSQLIIWLGIFISLAIKTPLWPLHIWLQKAHAEAPVGGSVALAALVLKLATYGFLRILLQFLPDASYFFSPLIQCLGVISIIYASLATLRQTDIKQLVALSSVAHMGVVVLSLFSNTTNGIEGGIVLSIAHGFVSPALFILVGAVLYDRTHTRTIRYYRGLTTQMPLFSAYFFLFTIANSGVPLTLNWVGEILGLTGLFEQNPLVAVLGATGIVFSAAYSIWVYNRVAFGAQSNHLGPLSDMNRRELMLLTVLLIPTILLGILPNVILNDLHLPVTQLIYQV